jgi:hypothetical protein
MADKITIAEVASIENASYIAMNSPNIKINQLQRLHAQMLGRAQYEPRQGGQGQNLRCKKDCCNNWALSGARKQLCPTHYATFLERSNKAQSMPTCSHCNAHTKCTFEEVAMCWTCQLNIVEERSLQASINEQHKHQQVQNELKMQKLDEAETVGDLREWIKQYML